MCVVPVMGYVKNHDDDRWLRLEGKKKVHHANVCPPNRGSFLKQTPPGGGREEAGGRAESGRRYKMWEGR